MPALIVTTGPEAGRRFELEAEAVIGRGKVDLVIADAELSRRHVAARPAAGGVEIEDLGSLNGTWCDGRRLEGPTLIPDGGTFRLGETEIVVELTGSAAATVVAAAAPAPPAVEPIAAAPPTTEPIPAPPPAAEPIPAPPPAAEPIPAPPPAAEPILSPPRSPPPPPPEPAPPLPVGAAAESAGPGLPPAVVRVAFPAAARRGRRQVATRMVVPALVTFLAIFATAIALIVYFATR